jgi:regulator of protease activity HflC (stomatin/prohibitin superfamily)
MTKGKSRKTEAARRRGYARGDADAVTRLLAALALEDEVARSRALDELASERREIAQRFVEESLRRSRERREALAAAAFEDTAPSEVTTGSRRKVANG